MLPLLGIVVVFANILVKFRYDGLTFAPALDFTPRNYRPVFAFRRIVPIESLTVQVGV